MSLLFLIQLLLTQSYLIKFDLASGDKNRKHYTTEACIGKLDDNYNGKRPARLSLRNSAQCNVISMCECR
jgi:hypothetical protein